VQSSLSTVADWRGFLSHHSSGLRGSEVLSSEDRREAGRLGRGPASEEAVLAAEARLGVRLPPSYRSFLLTSNGWNGMGLLDLFGVERIGWFPDLTDILDHWSSPDTGYFAEELEKFPRCLLISDVDDGSGGSWVLHADGAGQDGEWAGYEWWPGDGTAPERHDDFAAMVVSAVELMS
jgi:hypothetical protein